MKQPIAIVALPLTALGDDLWLQCHLQGESA